MGMVTLKKMACFLPGLGTPVSLYYSLTNAELRNTALKGLLLLPAAVILLSSQNMMSVPYELLFVASAYLYWGALALAGGWGFLAMLVAWRAVGTKLISTTPEPVAEEISELIPAVSISEVLPDLDANALLKGLERLPEAEKKELVQKIAEIESLPEAEKKELVKRISRELE